MSNVWSIDGILSDATTPGQSEPGSNGNERILHIPQSSKTEVSLSEDLMSYPGHLLWWESYLSAEIHSVYPSALADWARRWMAQV